jgi:arylsulfatase A-like enzyme
MTNNKDSLRNLVLVTVDSLRADHCGFVDSHSNLTPTIDRMANEGVAYTQAIAPGPRTPSSVPVLFTGNFMSNAEDWSMSDWHGRQQRIGRHMARFTHLSERLQRLGYETAAFTANPWTTRDSNFQLGFNDFNEISATSEDIESSNLSDSQFFKLVDTGFESLPVDPFEWSEKKEWFSQWTGYFDLITEKLSTMKEPFFLWVFILDTHQPYITPRRFREESNMWQMYYSIIRYWHGKVSDDNIPEHARALIARTYRDAVRSVDSFMKELEDSLTPFDAVTVFHSDHGEAIGDHQNFGHKQTLYEENLHVPFFVHNVGKEMRISEQVPLQSLPRILSDLVDTNSFDPLQSGKRFAISQTEDNQKFSVRTHRWKYILNSEYDCLYDLGADKEEERNVKAEYPEVTEALSEIIKRHRTTQQEKSLLEESTSELISENGQL